MSLKLAAFVSDPSREAYFCVRYFLKLGFLDGVARSRKLDCPLAALGPQNKFFGGYGWRWHFYQGLWYRWLVDREITNCVVRKR